MLESEDCTPFLAVGGMCVCGGGACAGSMVVCVKAGAWVWTDVSVTVGGRPWLFGSRYGLSALHSGRETPRNKAG